MATSTTVNGIALNDIVSFNTLGSGLSNIVNATVVGLVTGGSLQDHSAAALNHSNILPLIDDLGLVPADYKGLTYLVLSKEDKSIVEIATVWIVQSSVTRLDRKSALVVIEDFSSDKVSSLNELLLKAGFNKFNITLS